MCENPFNLGLRIPTLLSCSDDTVCKERWDVGFKQNMFKCPYKCGNANAENP